MSNPNMEAKVKELMELKRMKEEIEAEIAAAEDEIKAVMGSEETLLAGALRSIGRRLSPAASTPPHSRRLCRRLRNAL